MLICSICKKPHQPFKKFNGTFYKTCNTCRLRSLENDRKKRDLHLDELFLNALKKIDD